MNFTSVRGHLMNCDFPQEFQRWDLDTIPDLFNAPIIKFTTEDCRDIEKNLKRLAR